MPNITGIAGVLWYRSASCLRVLDRLACKGPATPDELAAELHNQEKYMYRLLRVTLFGAGRVHISGWLHNAAGRPTPVYSIGPGKSRPEPKPETPSIRAKRRRASLNAKFGTGITNRLLNPGRYGNPQIHIDGQRIRPGDHDAHLCKRQARP